MREPEEEKQDVKDKLLDDFEFSTKRKSSDDDYKSQSWDDFEPRSKFNDW